MAQEFWWFLLIGLLIGFALSTLWEWLYFRRQRMRIESRRVAELEAALRAAHANPALHRESRPWPAADFQGPEVYLENEGGTGLVSPPPTFPTDDEESQLARAAVILAAAAAANALTDEDRVGDDDSNAAGAPLAAAVAADAIQDAEQPPVVAAQSTDAEPDLSTEDQAAETAPGAEIESTQAVEAVQQEETAAAATENPPAQAIYAQQSYTVNNLSRGEYATVRILQSARHSARNTANRIGLGRFLPPAPKESA